MKEIGGYFELELRKGEEYHPNALKLNTGRNALELILITRKYSKVFIPYYTCDVILEPFIKHNVKYEFYKINNAFEPLFDYSNVKLNEGFLYTNYFGLKDRFISEISAICPNLIIDNTQSFFSKPISNIPTFYSCRKFFGVPDGAYLYINEIDKYETPIDYSGNRINHLIKRIDFDAEYGYNDFKNNDNSLIGQPILHMSKFTNALLCNIDYKIVKKIRIDNFQFLHQQLSSLNELNFDIQEGFVPMCYPLMINISKLKQCLIDNKIYLPTFWPNVLKWTESDSIEYHFAKQVLFLPIDQRYGFSDLQTMIKIIFHECKD